MVGRSKNSGGELRPLTQTEIEKINKAIANGSNPLRDAAIFHLTVNAGLRISELVSFKISDVFASNIVRERIAVPSFGKKNAVERHISLTHDVAKAIAKHSRSRLAAGASPDDPLFSAARTPEKTLSKNVAWDILRTNLKNAGLEHVSSNALRQTFARKLILRGANLQQLSELLGHKSLQTSGAFLQQVLQNVV
jgi:integrase/recombinase XerD